MLIHTHHIQCFRHVAICWGAVDWQHDHKLIPAEHMCSMLNLVSTSTQSGPNTGLYSVFHSSLCKNTTKVIQLTKSEAASAFPLVINSKRQWIPRACTFQANTAFSCTAPHPTPLPSPHSSDRAE